MLNLTQRGKHYHLVWCSAWLKEANAAILCEGEVGTKIQTLSYHIMTMSMTQTQRHTTMSCGAEYETERQTLLSCVVLNTTESQIPMEVCEEIMRGMPRCSKYKWRHNRDKREREKKIVGGLLYRFRFLSGGLMFGRWAVAPIPGQIYSKETTDSFFVSTRT